MQLQKLIQLVANPKHWLIASFMDEEKYSLNLLLRSMLCILNGIIYLLFDQRIFFNKFLTITA